ncbi:alcohol dehydrogenase catalytic domain-containing protein [Nonomuraea sp. KM90]|uniref:alcohol dehydrogenase catalytic domain-containing protein n=1 Tax=Nonomuraea sp. KM90 TaxID=3457428 RepID=UPI003FCE7963
MGRILVTGATGTVGRHAVALLRQEGAEVVALSSGTGDLRDPGSLPLDGVGAVLLVWPFATAEGAREVVAAIAGQARRVVYLSSAARRDHEREIERLIEASAREWTFLRPHAFAANALRWARQVRAGVVRGAYGAAAMPPVHERDVAAVAVRALLDEGHHGAALHLTGPETITQADQVRIISEVTGIPARWEELPPERARAGLPAEGLPAGVVDEVLRAQAGLVTEPAPVTSTVEEVTKVPASRFREWVAEHAGAFRDVPPAPPTMRAARIHAFGDASQIREEEVDTPRPGPGEVLVEVAATSFNPAEVGLRSGLLPEVFGTDLPRTLGWDVSGTVVETGAGVTGLAPGDRVFGVVSGAAAGYVVAAADLLARAPRSIPLADAAAVPVAGLTAWQAIPEHARITPGHRVLINGAGGGIGLFAVRLVKLIGAHVTATASPRSADAVRRLGADVLVDYTAEPLPRDMDVLLNLAAIPGDTAAELAGLAPAAVTVATPIEGATHFVTRDDPEQLAHLATLIDEGGLVVEVAESHPLSELPEIHRRAEAGDTRGKITIHP